MSMARLIFVMTLLCVEFTIKVFSPQLSECWSHVSTRSLTGGLSECSVSTCICQAWQPQNREHLRPRGVLSVKTYKLKFTYLLAYWSVSQCHNFTWYATT